MKMKQDWNWTMYLRSNWVLLEKQIKKKYIEKFISMIFQALHLLKTISGALPCMEW